MMTDHDLGGSMVVLLPERLDPNKKKSDSFIKVMNPPGDQPTEATAANGSLPSGVSSQPTRSKLSKGMKAPELGSVERRNWLVHLHYVRGEFDECLKLTKDLLSETRGMCEYANYVQALILRHQGKIQESLELFQLCNVLNPNSVQNLKQMARSLYLLGRHKRSVEAYKQAESKSSKPDWEIHYNLGVCYQKLGKLEQAKEQLQDALQLHRHHATFKALASVCLQQGDVAAAVSTYRAVIEQFPENSDLHACLGKLLLQTGRTQQAFEQLAASLTFQPKHSGALLAVGAMMQGHQDFDVALSKYRVAAQSIPESAALWNNIAMCFFGKKKYVAAISCLKRANYLAPFEWRVLYNLGLVHLTMQQTTSAFHFLSAAVNLKPTKGHIFMLLAVTLSQLEDESNARLAYKQAVSLETKDPSVCLNFAIFLLRQGDKQEAIKMYSLFEGRVVKLRQNTDLDPQVLEVGRKVAQELGQDTSALTQQREGRTRLVPRNEEKDEAVKDANLEKETTAPEGFSVPATADTPALVTPPPSSTEEPAVEDHDPEDEEEKKENDPEDEEEKKENDESETEVLHEAEDLEDDDIEDNDGGPSIEEDP